MEKKWYQYVQVFIDIAMHIKTSGRCHAPMSVFLFKEAGTKYCQLWSTSSFFTTIICTSIQLFTWYTCILPFMWFESKNKDFKFYKLNLVFLQSYYSRVVVLVIRIDRNWWFLGFIFPRDRITSYVTALIYILLWGVQLILVSRFNTFSLDYYTAGWG